MKQENAPEEPFNGESSVDGSTMGPDTTKEHSNAISPEHSFAEESAPVEHTQEYPEDNFSEAPEGFAYGQEQSSEPAKDKRPVRYALIGLAVGALVGFCGQYAVTGVQEIVRSANATVITAAVTECKVEDREGITVSDRNKKLTIDTKGPEEESGATSQNAVCLIQALQVPNDVLDKLDSTETDSGRQTTTWEERELSWEFTKDSGIQMELTITK